MGENRAKVRTGLYAVTIFLSAFLLFQVEPIIAKMILPWFGGSASVWSVCLLFFQAVLLLGYGYAHLLSTRVAVKWQPAVHLAVLAASLAALPILPRSAWKPGGDGDPAFRILLLLAVSVGFPYFVLSTTSPLLQAWYARASAGAKSPYRFYALSNLGSMLALLSYPVFVEPSVATRMQGKAWSVAYAAAVALYGWIALQTRPLAAAVAESPGERTAPPTAFVQSLWIVLPAIASALLLAVTNHISQNIASVPFLWILPLSLYLLSFILCFEGHRWYRRSLFLRLLGVALGGMAYAMGPDFETSPIKILVPLFCGGLFVACMFCHGEVARLKPEPRSLTKFYFLISVGGALGALFVALIAPRVFTGLTELPIAIGACAALAVVVVARDSEGVFADTGRRIHIGTIGIAAVAAVIVGGMVFVIQKPQPHVKLTARNFYGVVKVEDKVAPELVSAAVPNPLFLFEAPDPRFRELVNGTISHGIQLLMPTMKREPTTYYGVNSGVGIAIVQAGRRGPSRVGVIGLGAGTIAAYGRYGDSYRFYDINPLVIRVATHDFTFVHDSLAKTDIIEGDARLSLEREAGQNFDVLAVDAFTSDSIPVHLLTLEAFELYFKHLKEDGVLAVHVSNRYLDLLPVVRAAADRLGKKAVAVDNGPDDSKEVFSSTWVLVSNRELPYQFELMKSGNIIVNEEGRQLWTDDYSSVWKVLK